MRPWRLNLDTPIALDDELGLSTDLRVREISFKGVLLEMPAASTPAPATPVGWNCQNSMSSSGMPARAAMPTPSPVLMKALVEE